MYGWKLANLLVRKQLLRRRTIDRHLVERPVLGRAHSLVRVVQIESITLP